MSSRTATVHARLNPNLKNNVESLLKSLWLNTTIAINMFFQQIDLNKWLPFDVTLEANKKTKEVFKSTDEWRDLIECKDADDMFNKLGI